MDNSSLQRYRGPRCPPTKDFIGLVWRDLEFDGSVVEPCRTQVLCVVEELEDMVTIMVTDGIYYMPIYIIGNARQQLRTDPILPYSIIRVISWQRRSPPLERYMFITEMSILERSLGFYGDPVMVHPSRDYPV
jgi:hypothetical protein